MEALLPIMMAYAAAGLALSLAVHILSLFGIVLGDERLFFALHIGIFPLWFLVVMILRRALPSTGRSFGGGTKFWSVALSGCPAWMRYMTYGFFCYAIANFLFFFVTSVTVKQGSGPLPPDAWHGFSGHWMAFYSAGLAVSTSVYRRGIDNLTPRCPNGHPVSVTDSFCPTCGVALSPAADQTVA